MPRKNSKNTNTYHHGDLRTVLLDKAASILREEGDSALTMRHLASQAGVSRTAPYHHFKDKDELLCAIAEEGFRRFMASLEPAFTPANREQLSQCVHRFVRDYVSFAVENSAYYDLMFGGDLWKSQKQTDSLKAVAYQAFREHIERIKLWQEHEIASGHLDPLAYAQISWSTLHGMSRLLIDGIYVDSQTADTMCGNAAELLLQAIDNVD